MHEQNSDAESRAEAIKTSLTVRTNTAGAPIWYAVWRDSSGRRMMRTIGAAWLAPIPQHENVFIREAEKAERAKHVCESWRQSWTVRTTGKKFKGGALDHREAAKRAAEMVLHHERDRDDLRHRIARRKDPRTFSDVAARWLAEKRAEVRDGLLKPSTMADYAGVLAAPGEAKGRARAPKAHVIRYLGDRRLSEIVAQDIEEFLRGLRDDPRPEREDAPQVRSGPPDGFAYAVDEGWPPARSMRSG